MNVLKSIKIPKILLHEHLLNNISKFPDKIALESLDTGRKFTYNQVYKRSSNFAYFLQNVLKVKPNSTLALVLPNVPEFPIALLGALQANLKITTVNPNYTSAEIAQQFKIADVQLAVSLGQASVLEAIQINKSAIPNIIVDFAKVGLKETAINFEEVTNNFNEFIPKTSSSLHEAAILPFSSGTTGVPKGVELTHSNLVSNLYQMQKEETNLLLKTTSDHQDIIPGVLPFFHIYGLVLVLLHSLCHGCKIITLPHFSSKSFKSLIKNHKSNILYLVPPIVSMMIQDQDISFKDLDSLRTVMTGAAPFRAEDVERFLRKTNYIVDLLQGYGLTEASPLTNIQTNKVPNGVKIGGAGLLVANTEAKIISMNGTDMKALGYNKEGEICFRGPQVMKGYYKNPAATKEALTEDGWLRTGDIGLFDEDNHLFVTDRKKELIKVKGFQVAPAELEALLREHPAVQDCAVIGIPHPTLGEAPKAFIVTNNRQINSKHFEEFIAKKVSEHKHLVGGVCFVDTIPKNPSGKILRRKLKEMI